MCRALLERLAIGAMLVDSEFHVLYANSHARHLLRGVGPLAIRDGRLAGSSRRVAAALRRLLDAALEDGREASSSAVVAALPLAADLLLEVAVLPIGASGHRRGGRLRVTAWLVVDPRELPDHFEHTLAGLYGLTRMEARICGELAHDRTVAEAARAIGISIATVRTHLRAALRKTGARRQAELVRRITSGLAGRVHARSGPPAKRPLTLLQLNESAGLTATIACAERSPG